MNYSSNDMGKERAKSRKILRLDNGELIETQDQMAVEEPLEILLYGQNNGNKISKPVSITMRTPGHDEYLALGFLFTEGIIGSIKDIDYCRKTDDNQVSVKLVDDSATDLSRLERHFYTNSSCGVCGKASIENLRCVKSENIMMDDLKITTQLITGLNGKVRQAQSIFESTGGLHASASFDTEGKFIELFEDVGRHNALDKLIGKSMIDKRVPLNESLLFLSGRASFELIQKAAMAGIPVVCALGAPSSMAVELAEEFNMTLIGFIKEKTFNVYSGFQRIV